MAVTRLQVEHQLKRILESKIFRLVKMRGELLSHIVVGTLDGISLKETSLLTDFYKLSTEEIDPSVQKARIGVLRLRETLNKYNATDGIDDPIVIDIPKGQYAAEFTENQSSPARKKVRLGFHHVNEETPDHVKEGLAHFEKAIELEPDLADAWAGKASAYLTMTLHAYTHDPEELFIDAEEAATKAVSFDKSCWRGHANLGAIYMFRHEWKKADAAFALTKKLAMLDIQEIGGYGPYLIASGRANDALKLAQHYLDVGYDNAVSLTRAGLYFYALRHFDDAKKALLEACQINPNFWRSHLVLAFVYLSLNEPENALKQMAEVEYCARMNLWPGMKILCLEATGDSAEAERQYAALLALRKDHYVQPMQLALGCLARGDNETAISFLGEACDAHDPFTAWLRLWPFLDPLRIYPSFRSLLKKRDFPPIGS
jgi:tetratricopeptide (TPR) repeat protein